MEAPLPLPRRPQPPQLEAEAEEAAEESLHGPLVLHMSVVRKSHTMAIFGQRSGGHKQRNPELPTSGPIAVLASPRQNLPPQALRRRRCQRPRLPAQRRRRGLSTLVSSDCRWKLFFYLGCIMLYLEYCYVIYPVDRKMESTKSPEFNWRNIKGMSHVLSTPQWTRQLQARH